MSELSDLYKTRDTLLSLGEALPETVEERIRLLEEQEIQEQIQPLIAQALESVLQPIKRELWLDISVCYIPEEPISIQIASQKAPDETPQEEPSTTKVRKARAKSPQMIVRFPNGRVIAGLSGRDTFVETVKIIGVDEVRKVSEREAFTCCRMPLISKQRAMKSAYRKAQKPLGGGWFLMTNCSNESKKKFIDRISDALGLGLEVELEYALKE